MEKIDFRKDNIPFTQVANEVLNNPRLSAKAKGLYAYLYSKPDGWNFAIDRIANDFTDGRASINNGLQELEANKYLTRERLTTGRVNYQLKITTHFFPNPNVDFTKVVKSQSGKIDTISNKEGEVIKSISNTTLQSQAIVEVIDSFSQVNPAYKKWYANKTQRDAISRLIEQHTQQMVLKVIGLLKQTNSMAYMPSITTPSQLEDKWAQLANALKKKKTELQKTNVLDI